MRRLTRLLAGRRANGERGAVLVLTAFLVMFVAIGMLALTVDLGNVTYNRAQLQNGADASSLALATACANATATSSTPCGVNSDLTDLAVKNANVTDQSMTVLAPPASTKTCINDKGKQYVTAHGGTTTLPACGDPTAANISDLSACQPWPMSNAPNSVSYVEVTTQTKMQNGTSILPFHFTQILTNGKYVGSTSETCSRAAWGPAGSTGLTFPLTIGECDWKKDSASGGNYAPVPPYTPGPSAPTKSGPKDSLPIVPSAVAPYVSGIFSHSDADNRCSSTPNGGFDWLDPSANCIINVDAENWVGSDPGASVPTGCKDILQKYLGKQVAVPIFDDERGTGDGAEYHIAGIAYFYLAGWDNIPSIQPDKTTAVYHEPSGVCTGKCTSSTEYVWGWFTTGLLPIDSTINPGGDDFGAEVIAPAG
ncbi:MAG TPA: Tad domain-containing protein [Flexivirga sp.]|uniref:Tad domain-containing protein n=1 Tax=Flexivirga sp. TaxID=1962927 RepID=UPI002CAF5F34|nr:Tad domain-containing protein [Flexivirga sp.]HWC22243.1 Tad domain-containing protein [Flexivirga sp.]